MFHWIERTRRRLVRGRKPAGAKERTWTALPASPEVANTVIPVAPSDVVHSASAVISGLSAASAAASLISPTSQTGPTSTLRSRAGSPGGMPFHPLGSFFPGTTGPGMNRLVVQPSFQIIGQFRR